MSFRGNLLRAGIDSDGKVVTVYRNDGRLDVLTASEKTTGTIRSAVLTHTEGANSWSRINEVLRVTYESEYYTGDWVSAIVGRVDYGDAGDARGGNAKAITAEMNMPGKTYSSIGGPCYSLDCEFNCPTGFVAGDRVTYPIAFLKFGLWGGAKGQFDDEGYLFHLDGPAAGSGHLLSENSRTLRVNIGGTDKFIYLSDTEDDLGTMVVDTITVNMAGADGIILAGTASECGIDVTGTVAKGIDFTDATLTQAWNNAFFACGSGNGSGGDQHTMAVTDHYIPIQVNIASTAGPSSPKEVCAAMLRVDAKTANQGNSSVDVLALRSDLAKTVYAASGINQSTNISANMTVGTGSLYGIYCSITGAKTITCANTVAVFEARYAQTSGGGGVDSVAVLSNIAPSCSVTNILDVHNWSGTATNGILIQGAGTMTTGISITQSATTGLAMSGTYTDGILISGAMSDNAIEITGALTGGAIYIDGIAANTTATWTHSGDIRGYGACEANPGEIDTGVTLFIQQDIGTAEVTNDAIGIMVHMFTEDNVCTLDELKEINGISIMVGACRSGGSASTINGNVYGLNMILGMCNETLETDQQYSFFNLESMGYGDSSPTAIITYKDYMYGDQSRVECFLEIPYGRGITTMASGDYWISSKALTANSALSGATLNNDAALKMKLGGLEYWIPLYLDN